MYVDVTIERMILGQCAILYREGERGSGILLCSIWAETGRKLIHVCYFHFKPNFVELFLFEIEETPSQLFLFSVISFAKEFFLSTIFDFKVNYELLLFWRCTFDNFLNL
jgi:hypothetical protein